MKRYFKINRTTNGWDTDMTLLCFDELTGKYTSKRYKTILSRNFQSFSMIADKNLSLLEEINGVVEIEAEEFVKISGELREIRESLCETNQL